jgi:pyruvate kinase
VAILQDLSGPKIRIGRLEGSRPLALAPGDELRIATGNFEGRPGRVSTSYAELARSVKPGDRLLLDDGRIELEVKDTDGQEIRTRVVNGGPLAERKGINAPGVALPPASPTPKDIDDLRFGLAQGVDLVALSFVQSPDDLHRTRQVMRESGASTAGLVAKIERPEAVSRIEEIVAACDAVMIARGDLGLELPLEQVPRIQKQITRAARAYAVPVIVATQVFESMTGEPRPTRAEVSDAANAVDDGVDAIMLSGETAVGQFPVRAVQTLDAIIRDAEALPPLHIHPVTEQVASIAHIRALCEAATTLADSGLVRAIVAVTRGGRTARVLSAFRPRVPIFAATIDHRVARPLCLHRAVVPLVIEPAETLEVMMQAAGARLLADGAVSPGDRLVLVNVGPDLSEPRTNFVALLQV